VLAQHVKESSTISMRTFTFAATFMICLVSRLTRTAPPDACCFHDEGVVRVGSAVHVSLAWGAENLDRVKRLTGTSAGSFSMCSSVPDRDGVHTEASFSSWPSEGWIGAGQGSSKTTAPAAWP
jgi:hypothetical protein